MKKSIIALLAACVLITGTSAFAATSSLVGKKVAKEVVIEKDGVKSAKKAIIIEGVTYAPVRDIAEGTGYSVSYKGDVIVLESSQIVSEEPTTISKDQVNAQISTLNEKISWYKYNIESREINELKPDLERLEAQKAKGGTDDRDKQVIQTLEKKIKDSEDYIAAQQALITAAEAQITELQSQLGE
ncbi:hypothetical protein [Paenibacillus sp. sgz5001063]|uniref:hypothetical protein n=1 Tax=Paenibacillus sp. sgz5001063 TaxID=3242474 RepID=UPI0036D42BCA